jgi:hypothetical protein
MEGLTHFYTETPTWAIPFLAVFLLVLASYLVYHPHPFQRKTTGQCPPQIWTYLRAKPTPQQTTCINSWKKHHPTWTIRVMTPETVRGFLHQLPYPHEAPIFRDPECWQEIIALTTLEEHGGIWLDPDTLIRAPLDDFLPDSKEFVAFRHFLSPSALSAPDGASPLHSLPLLDKRMIASIPHHPLIRQWRSEYLRLPSFPSVEAYLQSLPDALLVSSFSFPNDWVMSIALQHVLLVKPYPMESLHLLSVDKPLHHLQEARGDPKKAEPIALNSKEPIVFLGGSLSALKGGWSL